MKKVTLPGLRKLILTLPLFVTPAVHAGQAPDIAITGRLSDGSVPAKQAKPPAPQRVYKVRSSHTRAVGNRMVTIQEVEPPADLPAPWKATQKQPTRTIETSTSEPAYPPAEFIIVTSTVYGKGDNTLTKLSVWHRGEYATCWSNINGHYLTGFDQFRANNQPYWMISTAGNAANPTLAQAAKDGCPVRRLRRGGRAPRFAVTSARKPSPELRRTIANLHKLYRVEKPRLAAAHASRLRHKRLRASLPAPPPEPSKPVTIRFWKRDTEKERSQNTERRAK